MQVTNLSSPTTGKPIANQFLLISNNTKTFKSYNTIIAKQTNKTLYIDRNALDYSATTLKYLKVFLNTIEPKNSLQKLLKTGNLFQGKKVVIKDLNN